MRSEFLPYGLHDIDEEDINAVVEVLKSDWITGGPKIEEFEKKFCEYTCCGYAVAVNSGTAALDIAVASLELPQGSEVITTPYTFVATSNSIIYNNCRPVFADIKPDTFNIDPKKVAEKITGDTKAILCVDFAGQPCDLDELRKIASDNSLHLVEDGCHAVGAEYKGKKVGSISDLTAFSFHPVKHITTGEGGMVTTDDKKLYEKMRMLRNHGINKDSKERFGPKSSWAYDMSLLGRNYRTTDFQAALGISQLAKLDAFIEKRSRIVERYNNAFRGNPVITTPQVGEGGGHAWHLYTILVSGVERNEFFQKMRDKNIGVNVHYNPVYKHSYYKKNFSFNKGDYPVTEDVSSRIITLPLFTKMTNKEIEEVINSTDECIDELR